MGDVDLEPFRRLDTPVILVSDMTDRGEPDHLLRGSPAKKELTRICRGAYLPTRALELLDRDARYDAAIDAVVGTRHKGLIVLSHHSAARIHGLPVSDGWPREVHIAARPDSARRTRNGVRVHHRPLADGDIRSIGGYLVTSLERTLLDLARDATFVDAVVVIDAALDRRHPRVSLARLRELLASSSGSNLVRARRVLEFVTPLSQSPWESTSRVVIHELGFPAPILQHLFIHPDGGRRFADFWWEGERLIGEFDGRVKYDELAAASGLDGNEVAWQDKLRENELGDHHLSITRWTADDVRVRSRLKHRLEVAGLRVESRARRGAASLPRD